MIRVKQRSLHIIDHDSGQTINFPTFGEIGGESITVTGTDPVITGAPNTRYVCGEVYSLSITPPAEGIMDVTFSCGTTVAVLTLPSTVKMPEWWTGPEPGYAYEISIMDGVYGAVMSWEV